MEHQRSNDNTTFVIDPSYKLEEVRPVTQYSRIISEVILTASALDANRLEQLLYQHTSLIEPTWNLIVNTIVERLDWVYECERSPILDIFNVILIIQQFCIARHLSHNNPWIVTFVHLCYKIIQWRQNSLVQCEQFQDVLTLSLQDPHNKVFSEKLYGILQKSCLARYRSYNALGMTNVCRCCGCHVKRLNITRCSQCRLVEYCDKECKGRDEPHHAIEHKKWKLCGRMV